MAIRSPQNENGVYEFPYKKREAPKTKWESVKLAVWNPSTKEFFGRDFGSWSKIILFYIIFYIALSGLFAICMVGLYGTISYDRPSYTAERSIIGMNPGLGFRPLGDVAESTIIKYGSDNTSQQKYIGLMNDFFKEYDRINAKVAPLCTFDDLPQDGRACPVNVTSFSQCNPPYYGYLSSSPCVFLKLNRIYHWKPEYYNSAEDLPSKMPSDLVAAIKLAINNNQSDQVWVSCVGEYPSDKEHVVNFNYFPSSRGFPGYYFPYQHKKDEYLSPLVAVQIVTPKAGVQVNIECRAWAKNIVYEGGLPEHRKGSVRLEILREE